MNTQRGEAACLLMASVDMLCSERELVSRGTSSCTRVVGWYLSN